MQKSILLVEENPDDVVLAMRALQKNDITHEVVIVRDDMQALEYLFAEGEYEGRDPDQQPVVILLDLKLSKIDGIEVLNRIKNDERTRHLPVVVLTTSNEERDISASYESGANSYIRKPVDYDHCIDVVGSPVKYWLLMNEVPPKRGDR